MRKCIGKKSKTSASVISGSDGPTSIFIGGKEEKTGLIERIKRKRYQKQREKTEKTIVAEPHTLEEVIQYMKENYGAEEVSKDFYGYTEQWQALKESLIIQHKPELLGEWQEISKPESLDEQAIENFFKKIEQRSEKAKSVPDELMPIDYHIYIMHIEKLGEIQVEIEKHWEILSAGYQGKTKKEMKKLAEIVKDIYLYYGVSKEDIDNRSERFKSLVTTLTLD